MVRLPFYIIFWGQQIEKKTRNAWQSLAYSPLGDVVSPQTAKYSNFCIIKTINAIKTKFCTVIKTIKFSFWSSQNLPHKSKMADGRHLEKK